MREVIPIKKSTKRNLWFFVFFALTVFVIFELYALPVAKLNSKYVINYTKSNDSTKYILYWTKFFGSDDFSFGFGSELFKNCPIRNCYATNNRTILPIDRFDAIIFHGREYDINYHKAPKKRNPHQYYIFAILESPLYTPKRITNLDNFFNLTMTYRLDSDIVWNYGHFDLNKTDYKLPTPEFVKKRPKTIAWMVSNCQSFSQRGDLYEKLSEYLDIHIYGQCGTHICPKKEHQLCYEMLENSYSFYLSFENSICKDYVTEKLFNIMKKNVVPITYGGANYSEIVPPNSIVDATKFNSAKELATYIKMLNEQPEEYIKLLEWKKEYIVNTENDLTLCSLCEKLNRPIEQSVYSDIYGWWFGTDEEYCKIGKELPKIVST